MYIYIFMCSRLCMNPAIWEYLYGYFQFLNRRTSIALIHTFDTENLFCSHIDCCTVVNWSLSRVAYVRLQLPCDLISFMLLINGWPLKKHDTQSCVSLGRFWLKHSCSFQRFAAWFTSAVQLHGTRRCGSCLISKHGLVSWTYSRAPLIVEGANATCGTVGYTAMDGSIGRGGPHVCTSVRTSPAFIIIIAPQDFVKTRLSSFVADVDAWSGAFERPTWSGSFSFQSVMPRNLIPKTSGSRCDDQTWW